MQAGRERGGDEEQEGRRVRRREEKLNKWRVIHTILMN